MSRVLDMRWLDDWKDKVSLFLPLVNSSMTKVFTYNFPGNLYSRVLSLPISIVRLLIGDCEPLMRTLKFLISVPLVCRRLNNCPVVRFFCLVESLKVKTYTSEKDTLTKLGVAAQLTVLLYFGWSMSKQIVVPTPPDPLAWTVLPS